MRETVEEEDSPTPARYNHEQTTVGAAAVGRRGLILLSFPSTSILPFLFLSCFLSSTFLLTLPAYLFDFFSF